jgi:serine/threonine-protein kinase
VPEVLAPEFVALQQAVAGRYSLERELGRGGMGIVFLARDVALDRLVAIKLLPPMQASQPGLRERFLREAQTAAKLSHPNIVAIYLVEQAGDLVFFVMAYVEGETLGQRLRARGPLQPAAAVRLLQEVAWALAYAHLRGIIHRDVKPDNILLEAGTNRAMVTDFGIARAGEITGSTAVGEILGTAQYMSPEQACGEHVDGRSDLYSLGVVGFLALSGRLPFDAPDTPSLLAQHITKPAPPLAGAAPGVPQRLAQAIDRCLAKDAAARFQTGEQFAEALTETVTLAREMPAPVRVWLTKGEGARGILYAWTGLAGMVALGQVIQMLTHGGGFDGGLVRMVAIPWALYGLHRTYQTQRVIAAGYGFEDLKMALRHQLEQRREELAYEYGHDPTILARAIRWIAFGGVAAAAAGAIYAAVSPAPSWLLTAWLMGAGSAAAIGGAVIGRFFPGRRIKAKDSLLEYRLRLADTWFGRAMFRLSGIGVKRAALSAASTYRPTEVAIGMAADALFEALPKKTRRELKDMPSIIRRLEAEATLMRARVDELNTMIAGLGDEALSAQSASLKESGAGAVVEGQRGQLRTELTSKRDQASQRLAVSVAALENLRLDLLRLKAGVGTVDQLTADLNAARDLQREIEIAVEAHREVEAALRDPAAGP